MVPIIENYSNIAGRLEKIHRLSDDSNYFQINLFLEKSEEVEGFPNLAQSDIGTVITINVKIELLPKLTVGNTVKIKVKKVNNKIYNALVVY